MAELMVLRCAYCLDDFTPRNSRARCCSSLCGSKLYYIENKERIKASVKLWKKAHHDRVNLRAAEYQRAYRKRRAVARTQPEKRG